MSTQADRALIAYAAARGEVVNSRQLKRWRTEGLLPPRTVRGRGRGLGVEGVDGPHTASQVVEVSRVLARDRSFARAALRLWYDLWDVPTELVAAQVAAQAERLRERYEDLERQAREWLGGEPSPFDVAELDSDAMPITHVEVASMTVTATEETRRDLARAARILLQGQLLSPPDEPSAIDEDLARHYLGLPDIAATLGPLAEATEPAFDAFLSVVESMNPGHLTRPPSVNLLEEARAELRRRWEAEQIVRNTEPVPSEEPAVLAVRAFFDRASATFDTRHDSYHPGQLLLALWALCTTAGRVEYEL